MPRWTSSRLPLSLAALVLLLSLLAAFPAATSAATFVVGIASNDGPGSLRQAIIDANASPGPDVITFASIWGPLGSNPEILLSSELPPIVSPITIQSPGSQYVHIDSNNASYAFRVDPAGALSISGVTITGGGIFNAGQLTIERSTVRDAGNSLRTGGAITNTFTGEAVIRSSTLSNNVAGNGGAVYNAGDSEVAGHVTIINSTIALNSATAVGGGVGGGGIMNDGGTMTIIHSTITKNTADSSYGGGILAISPVTLIGTIVAGNNSLPGPDVSGAIIDGGYNLLGSSVGNTGLTDGVNGNIVGGNADLQPLADNGGMNFTVALGAGSDARNHIPASDCVVPVDQRGIVRETDGSCDIGAFEEYDPTNLAACLYAGSLSQVRNIGDAPLPDSPVNCGRGAQVVLATHKEPAIGITVTTLTLYACLHAGQLSQVGWEPPVSCGRGALVGLSASDGLYACLYAGSLSRVGASSSPCGRGELVKLDTPNDDPI